MLKEIDFRKIIEDIDMRFKYLDDYDDDDDDDYIPEFLMEGCKPTSVKYYGDNSELSNFNLPKIININGVEYVQTN